MAEIDSELDGLPSVQISHVVDINPGVDKSLLSDDDRLPFIAMPAVEARTGKIDTRETRRYQDVKTGFTSFQSGDVLFAKITPCMENGKMAIFPHTVPGVGFGSTEFHVLRPTAFIDNRYLYYFVSSSAFRHEAQHNMSGAVGQKRVPKDFIAGHEIPITSINEQRRVVEKIEVLFSQLDKGEEAIRAVQALLKRYRQSVLKAAVTGELTAGWRAENSGKLEHGRDLLARILKSRRDTWSGRGQYKEPVAPDTSDLPELPDGWAWATLGQLISLIEAGKNVRCIERAPKDQETGIVKISAVTWDQFDEWESKTIQDEDHLNENALIQHGDLLISRANTLELVGASVVVEKIEKRLQLSDKVLRLKPVIPIERWINYVLKSRLGRHQIESRATGAQMSMRNISQRNLETIAVPIPSLEEMTVIVDSIKIAQSREMATTDQLELELARSSSLRQSILKDAFTGRLVEQDPTDEPATDLLARIKAARADTPKKSRGRPSRQAMA
ncbi:MAG: restriction endonuclease subunit S [Gammaproteobacteria bacterium]|uniref:restriction endonuclease subunit S n=1 Tax=Thalassobaculum sp. TaxID=2022740 RepID=UPI0032EF7A51